MEGYNLDALLKKKRKNLYNRMHATGNYYSGLYFILKII